MKTLPLPDPELLRHLFSYNPDTGELRWRNPPHAKIKVGAVAGHAHRNGYLRVSVHYRDYMVHRIIWAICHGEDPGHLQIDHKNGCRTDNHISNLRLATQSENGRNSLRGSKQSLVGVKGVSWNPVLCKWVVQVAQNEGNPFSGFYLTMAEASVEARRIREEHHGEFCNHGTPPTDEQVKLIEQYDQLAQEREAQRQQAKIPLTYGQRLIQTTRAKAKLEKARKHYRVTHCQDFLEVIQRMHECGLLP